MAGSPRRRLLHRVVVVGIAGAASLVVVLAGPASAATVSPPPGPYAPTWPPAAPAPQWIAFQFDSTSISNGGTVTLSAASGGATPTQLWGSSGSWPGSWSVGGLTLAQAGPGPCTVAAHPTQSCEFKVVSSPNTYSQVVFGLNLTDSQAQNFSQTIQYEAPATTTTTQPPAPSSRFSGPGELATPGSFTFTPPADNPAGVAYTWTLLFNGNQIDSKQCQGPSCTYTPPASIFNTPGTYTMRLQATGPTGQSENEVPFIVPAPQPAPPPPPQQPPPPAAQPQASTGAHPGSAPAFTQVSFTPRLTDFATPKPGAVQPVTVIWLWRPDWFQATTNQKPKTAGRPTGASRAAVSVGSNRGGPSATPWLAGLAMFGIFGAAWLAVRRRRVRTSILD